ncbi:MAG: glycosyltransferase [Flavobacteriales bacterium]|nr:glycosyltransferase [Flavobacteriales bacterium]
MKIGYVTLNQGSDKGGSEKLWRKSVFQALEKGHDVVISVYENSLRATIEIFKELNLSIETRRNFNGFTLWRRVGLYSKRFFNKTQIDAVVISCGGLAELELKINQTRTNNLAVPYVILVHSNTDHWGFSRNNQIEIADILKNAEKVFFVSQRLIRQTESQLNIKLTNASMIKNPIEQASTSPIPKTKEIAFIGTLDIAVKGIGVLIESFSNTIWDERGVILNVYGEGKDEKEIRSLIKTFRVENRVKMHGWVGNIDEMWDRNSTLISTSFNEGMPMVIQEALMRGRLVVATDVGGNTEIIEDGMSGYIAKHPTVKAVNEALERWWNDKDNWNRVAKEGTKSVKRFLNTTPGSELILKTLTHD